MLQSFSKWSIPACRALNSLQQSSWRSLSGPASQQEKSAVPSHTNYFHLQLILKSFELKYIHQASVAVRDLLLLNFAPKHKEVLPDVQRSSIPSNLIFSVGDVAVPQRISRYTVLRSPHVDKKSREQFEKRVHKRSINISTVSSSELYWFLQHLKLYEFFGVQIQVNVSSRQFLVPPAQVPSTSILSNHRAACSDLYAKAALQPAAQTPAELVQEAVGKLQNAVLGGTPAAAELDTKIVAAAPRRADYQAILQACKAVVLSLDSSSLNNSKLLLSRFAAVSTQDSNATFLLHNLMKLGLWLSKLQQLTGEKDARQAMEFLKFTETACQTLLDAYLLQQFSVPVKHAT